MEEPNYFLVSVSTRRHLELCLKKGIAGFTNWEPVTFRESGRPYYFPPFRLYLKLVRGICEPLVRSEFAYVAENLLLQAGYRKTLFQADQIPLQNVSQMGSRWNGALQPLNLPAHNNVERRFTLMRHQQCIPFICPFQVNFYPQQAKALWRIWRLSCK